MNVIRIENASLLELVHVFMEIIDTKKLAPGTCILLGSLSYLGSVGASIYAGEWRAAVHMLNRRWEGVLICPMIHIVQSTIDGSILRDVLFISKWFKKIYEGTTQGLSTPWDIFINILTEMSDGEYVMDNPDYFTYPLPASLDAESPYIPWKFSSYNSSPAQIHPMDRRASVELVRSLSTALDKSFGFIANPEGILARDTVANSNDGSKDSKGLQNIICIGGSCLGKIIPGLLQYGGNIIDLTHPGWIINEDNIDQVVGELETLLPRLEGNSGVILDLFGNSTTKFKHVDGALVLPIKINGKFHLLGEVTVETDEGCRNLIRIAEPLFRAIEELPTIISPPSPRYVFSKCCAESSHAPNTGDPDHAAQAIRNYEHVRSVLKSELVGKDWLKNFWVMSSLSILGQTPVSMEEKLAGLRQALGSDGVHYTDLGYQNWVQQMSDCMTKVLDRADRLKKKEVAAVIISGGTHFWRGFTSPVGSVRRTTTTTARQAGQLVDGRGRGRMGGGRGSGPRGRGRGGHGGKPYDHFGQRRF